MKPCVALPTNRFDGNVKQFPVWKILRKRCWSRIGIFTFKNEKIVGLLERISTIGWIIAGLVFFYVAWHWK
jgi:hypothetical protein